MSQDALAQLKSTMTNIVLRLDMHCDSHQDSAHEEFRKVMHQKLDELASDFNAYLASNLHRCANFIPLETRKTDRKPHEKPKADPPKD